MVIVRPQILSELRQHDSEISAGDAVTVLVRPGLLGFLQLKNGQRTIGDWWSPEYTIAFSSAVTAGQQLTHLASRPDLGEWTPWSYTADWRRPMQSNEAVIGSARLEKMNAAVRVWTFSIRSIERGDDLATGTVASVPIRQTSKMAARVIEPVQPPLDPYGDLDQLHEPIVTLIDLSLPRRVVDSADEKVFELAPGLLHLLMNPVGGHNEPLGRRSHPLGSIHLGAAIFAARSFVGSAPLLRSELILHSPIQLPSPVLHISCRVDRHASRFICSLMQSGVVLSTARLRFANGPALGSCER